ncbi:GntR family transcriptional regulator [Schaalia sp. Marseille-Q2122]|uniref:GntR family transcriptional regulator n=1 Tax=Schaalia sp. Marseille-Q2122 TaxID=2736604 RepID=UPI00158C49D2|nr:GntR family transcriptional regulator [Schaalia sp. Marseille-Q2122]
MDLNDSRPLWIQLVEEFRRRIVSGEWGPGSKLPSVRELALELGVNPNTIQKALGELDREHLTQTERTAGRFVTSDADLVNQARIGLAQEATDTYVSAMKGLGITAELAADLITTRWDKEDPR